MTILLFILVLVALIVVHELGHFFAAKWAGMRVEEFGIGYPPRAMTFARHNGTEYTLNWLPFGGFVKIFGEDGDGNATDSFTAKPHFVQGLVLLAGIFMNLVFAWILLSLCLGIGLPRALAPEEISAAPDARIIISRVVEESPAAVAGLMAGDEIASIASSDNAYAGADADAFTSFVASEGTERLTLIVNRGGEELTLSATPVTGVIPDAPERAALGVGVATVGTVPVSLLAAPVQGAELTWSLTQDVARGLVGFFASVFTLSADLSQVSGPVGIAGAVGTASEDGLVSLLALTAVISINLALINVLPIPALDGGRFLFVVIEAITRKRIPESFAGAVNALGFGFLILLMVAITASDIFKLL